MYQFAFDMAHIKVCEAFVYVLQSLIESLSG